VIRSRPLALAAAVALALVACGTNPEPTTFVCTAFRPGADLSKADFGAPPEIAVAYGALAQAAADMSVVSASLVIRAQSACVDLALGLGAKEADARLSAARDRTGVKDSCAIAAERVATARASLAAAGVIVRPLAPRCPVDADVLGDCEARCKADPGCAEAPSLERCAPEDREGACAGACSGACIGSELAPASCEGTCEGTCFGVCDDGKKASGESGESGEASAKARADACAGAGCVCKGTCTGRCSATCKPRPGKGGFACDGACRAGCSGPLANAKCAGELAPPRCKGDVDCQAACAASASARATCEVAAVAVSIADHAKVSADLARIVGVLERDLPVLVVANSDHARAMKERASSLVDAAGRLLAKTQDLGTEAAACGLVMGQAGTEAKDDLTAVSGAAQQVIEALDPKPKAPEAR
jgi:hypothetical protein